MNTPISRRTALGGLAAGAALMSQPMAQAQDRVATKGNIKQSVSRWCYGDIALPDFCKACAEMGLKGIDLVGPDDWPVVKDHGLVPTMVPGAGSIPDSVNDPKLHDDLLASFRRNIPRAAENGCPNVITFSGNRKGMTDYVGLVNSAQVLREAVKIAEDHGVTICMELLNSKVDHKDYMCDRTLWGVALCEMVGSDHFKLLHDIYHMQIMEGDIIRHIQRYHEYIGHYHTGGVPGRNEIDETQELYYPAIMKAIVDTGYDMYVAHEYVPTWDDKLASLRQGAKICDV